MNSPLRRSSGVSFSRSIGGGMGLEESAGWSRGAVRSVSHGVSGFFGLCRWRIIMDRKQVEGPSHFPLSFPDADDIELLFSPRETHIEAVQLVYLLFEDFLIISILKLRGRGNDLLIQLEKNDFIPLLIDDIVKPLLEVP